MQRDPKELLAILAQNQRNAGLRKDLPEKLLPNLESPTPTIAKFEQKHTISLASLCGISKSVGLFQSYQGTFI